jgi:integrase
LTKALTAAAVGRLRPGVERIELADGGCPGLNLIIQPSGAKSWALRFRRPDGRPAKLTLGSVFDSDRQAEPSTEPTIGGHLTLAAARRLVGELRHEIAQGRDPASGHLADKRHRAQVAAQNASNTFAAAARDFIEGYARKRIRRWEEMSRLLGLSPDDLSILPKGLSERWSKRPIVEIDGHDIHSIVDETRQRGAPGIVRRADGPTESRARAMFATLSKMFAWLLQHRRVEANPCASVHRPEAAQARDRVLTNNEIVRFWLASDKVGEPFGAALKLLLITGARLNEVSGMLRSELNDAGIWSIPSERTKNKRPHIVPLPPLAQDILANVPRIEGGLVFTTTGTTPISGWSKIKARLDGLMGDVPHWRLHDLRRTAATTMAEIGVPPHIVEAVLNHISGAKASVAGVYNRAAYAAQKKAALERWAAHIEGIVSGRPATIVPLRAGRADDHPAAERAGTHEGRRSGQGTWE